MKAVDFILQGVLPPDLHDPGRVWDKKGTDQLLADVASKYPERYSHIVQTLSDLGRHAAYRGGITLTLNDMRPVLDKTKTLAAMDKEVLAAKKLAKTPEEFNQLRESIWHQYSQKLEEDTMEAARLKGSNLANTVVSGARGNPAQLKAMVTTPGVYADHREQTVPLFIRSSFGEGLRPAEYIASTFGVRKSVISSKVSTAKGGDFSKITAQTAADQVVMDDDCGTTNGMSYDTEGKDALGRILLRSAGSLEAGTPLDRTALLKLRKEGVSKVMTRSPLTCQSEPGICSHCLGLLPTGRFAPKGYHAGTTAANALGEPVTQGALNVKHTGGQTKGRKVFSGFDVLSQLVQSPEVFPDRAAVAEHSGRVTKIEPAPQGGNYVFVGDKPHYTLPGFSVLVKPGEAVEPGDVLSDGVVDSSDIVRLRGLGEGRQYLADRLKRLYQDTNYGTPSRTNLELISRAMLNHVRVESPEGYQGHLPDDVVNYQTIASNYSPPKDAKMTPLASAKGQYLQAPYLHHTIGTQLTPRMISGLQESGYTHVLTHPNAPSFAPETVRLRAAAHSTPDWLARLNSSYLMSGLEHSAIRAQDTNIQENVHFAPRLMVGEGFGKKVEETGKF